MFTGIIEHTAKILDKKWGLFRVENTFEEPLILGQSIAHDGACMTLTKIENEAYEFFVMEESLSITNLCDKKVGEVFNVERSLKLGDRIDGHMVSGHVDTVWKVIQEEFREDGSFILTVWYDPKFDHLLIRKGSITINGVSLTVVTCWGGALSVSLIPLTQKWTNLASLGIARKVNLEFDMIAKYMSEQMKNYLQAGGKSI